MKAMSLKLLKGKIDQVGQVLTVTWLVPRLLDSEGIRVMYQKYRDWSQEVQALASSAIFKKVQA